MENTMEVPQTIKNGNAVWLSNLTSRYLSKRNQIKHAKRGICTPMFTAGLFCSQDIDKWMDK
jgi:hypothetical protein